MRTELPPQSASHFSAPWGRLLKVVSAFVTIILTGASLAGLSFIQAPVSRLLAAIGPLLVLAVSLLFMVRSYTVQRYFLLVHRPFWNTSIPLTELRSVVFEPGAMKRSLRLFGNGGLFSFTGWFRNQKLGTYRAFVTDPNRCVVLQLASSTIVVSPDRPEAFVEAARARLPEQGRGAAAASGKQGG